MSEKSNMLKYLVRQTFRSASDHNIALHGAAIAFYTIFSIAPLILITVALVNLALGEQHSARALTDFLIRMMGRDLALPLLELTNTPTGRPRSGVLASVVATAMLLFGSTTVITQLKHSLNTIWGITRPRINSVVQYIFNRILGLFIIFVLTLLLIVSLLLEGGLLFFSEQLTPWLPELFTPLLQLLTSVLSIAVTIVFFTLLFKLLPDVSARWGDIFIGACVTTILFLAGKYLVGFYLANSMMHAGYKAVGGFIIFLVWIYYNVQVALIGAEFTQVYIKQYGRAPRPTWNAEIISPD